ncbi:MAG: hypothetical protein JWN48_4106, partial [Myxococcaceae bacterium]|nr:hypothetical protein [Myxococcaceae bacterium]
TASVGQVAGKRLGDAAHPAVAVPTTVARPSSPAPAAAAAPARAKSADTQPTTAATSEPKSGAPASELALLLQARKLVPVDPNAALQILAEHARRFPRGQLAPEREVLRIEALRKLGRFAEANERLRQFRRSYPDSMHTPGLLQGTQ